MLALQDVEKIVQSRNNETQQYALKDINFECNPGEILGILGRSQSGKTTLLRCIHGLERPNRGSIVLDNSPLTLLNEQALRLSRRHQGMVFQEPYLLDHRTVYENVALPLEISGKPTQERNSLVHQLLQLTGVLDKEQLLVEELNLGQKYRVCIARALVHNPLLLLCDDITLNCDTKTRHGLLKLLREINERLNTMMILATQDMEVIKTLCHRVIVLHQGEIVEQSSVLELFTHPKSEVGKEFVKTATRLEMPTALRKRLKSQWNEHHHPVLRLSFENQQNKEALIAHVVQHFGLNMNILQAHLEPIRDDHIGIIVLELRGNKTEVQNAIQFLIDKDLPVEVLGYVT